MIFKAQVQFNDFVGSAAADISDHSDLKKFLVLRKVDVERYEPVGASFYSGYNHNCNASIICLDRIRSSEGRPYLVDISFEGDFDSADFFNLFKRFNVMITSKTRGYYQIEISEEIVFDDRPSPEVME